MKRQVDSVQKKENEGMKILKKFYLCEVGDSVMVEDHSPSNESCWYITIQTELPVAVVEKLDSERYSIFTWSASFLLSVYLVSIKELILNSVVLEIGAGTALPSMVCGKLKARKVYVSEREDETDILMNIQEIISLNKMESVAEALPFNWGNDLENLPLPIDIILGADVFYSSENFDSICFTVFSTLSSSVFSGCKDPCFLTSYQIRR
jgi:predicted nicotinamide N-methyase